MALHTFKPGDPDIQELKAAARLLKRANGLAAAAKKDQEAAKLKIATWLKESRSTKLDELPIGDVVTIEDVVLITIESRRAFDQSDFKLKQPILFGQFERPFPVHKFKALV